MSGIIGLGDIFSSIGTAEGARQGGFDSPQ
jgi:hypothetical protein